MRSVPWLLAVVICVFLGCAKDQPTPQLPRPHQDVDPSKVNPSLGDSAAVLVASSKSDFKDAVVKEVADALARDSVCVKVIRINPLEKEDAARYSAVVLVNTCMGGKMEKKVGLYMEKNPEYQGFIVLTTSGNGEWLPLQEGRCFDAISSASKDERVAPVAADIVAKVRLKIRPPQQAEQQAP